MCIGERRLQFKLKRLISPSTMEKVMAAFSPSSSSVATTVSTLAPAGRGCGCY